MEKKLFTREECNSIIEESELLQNYKVFKKNGCSYQMTVFTPNENISSKIIQYTKTHLNLEITNVNLAVVKYLIGDYIGRHIDRNPENEFNKNFIYNINTRLNDDYTGGQFYLNDNPFYSEVGDTYHYKSTIWHESKPVTDGVKYTALFYIREQDVEIKKSFI